MNKAIYLFRIHDNTSAHKIFNKYYRSKEAAMRAALKWIYATSKDFDDEGKEEEDIIEWEYMGSYIRAWVSKPISLSISPNRVKSVYFVIDEYELEDE